MRIVLKLVATLAIAFLIPAAAVAAQLDCVDSAYHRQKMAIKENTTTTSTTTAVNIGQATITNLTVNNDSCFLVQYTGQFKAPKGARITLVVSGVMTPPVAYPVYEDIVTSDYDSRTLTFIVRDAPTCSCTVQLKFQSLVNGQPVTAARGILRVEYYDPT